MRCDVELPAREEVEVPVRWTLTSFYPALGKYMIESRRLAPGVYMGRAMLPPRRNDITVRIINTTKHRESLSAGTCLGQRQRSPW